MLRLGLIHASHQKSSECFTHKTDRKISTGMAQAGGSERGTPPGNITPFADDAPRYEEIDSALKELLATGVDEVGDVWVKACDVQHRI